MLATTLLGACQTTEFVAAPINPDLVSHIPDAELKGRTWDDVYIQDMERGAIIKRWNCRGHALRKEPLPPDCTADTVP